MNRQIYPVPLYPLAGDVTSIVGGNRVTVTGLQNTQLDALPLTGGEKLEFNPNTGTWQPILRATIQVNGLSVSDDWIISVNVKPLIQVNGM